MNKTEGIIQQDLRTYPVVSLKGFADLSEQEQEKIANEIYLQLKRSENGENFVLDPALDKLEFMGLFLLPPRGLELEEVLKEDRERLNNLHSVANWDNEAETKQMIFDEWKVLFEAEQKKGSEYSFEYKRNLILVYWLSDKLATLIKDEIITRLENLEI